MAATSTFSSSEPSSSIREAAERCARPSRIAETTKPLDLQSDTTHPPEPEADTAHRRERKSRTDELALLENLKLPHRLKHYVLLEEIGRGGMGVIYRARHVHLDRMVALKILRRRPEREESLRFIAEAQITGQIEHPNIVPIHEVDTDEHGRPFFVMKLVRGRSLAEILKDLKRNDPETVQEFSQRRLLTIFTEICQAVAFAHAAGVLHRDIKPGNVMVGDFGEVLLMDWGLAKKIEKSHSQLVALNNGISRRMHAIASAKEVKTVLDARQSPETVAGFVAGTPEYMAPEQAAGEPRAYHPRCDIYSLGALLFEILTFRPPHTHSDTRTLIRMVATQPVVFPELRVSRQLKAIVLKATAYEPQDRYPSAMALLEDVNRYLDDEAPVVCPDRFQDKFARLLRRHGAVAATAAAAAMLLLLGTALAFFFLEKETAKKLSAMRELAELQEINLKNQELTRQAKERERQLILEQIETLREKDEVNKLMLKMANRLKVAVPHFLLAFELLKRNRNEEALQHLKAIVENDPYSPVSEMAWFHMGEAYNNLGDSAQVARDAIAAFEEADKMARAANSSNPHALLRCGEIAEQKLFDPSLALEFFSRAAQCDLRNPYTLLAQAYRLIRQAGKEQRQAAEAALSLSLRASQMGRHLWEAHDTAGGLYAGRFLPDSGCIDLHQAIAQYSAALKIRKELPELWMRRADAYRQLGEWHSALSDYHTAIRLDPDAPETVHALNARAQLLVKLGRPQEALRDFDQAQLLKRGDYDFYLHRGQALLEVGHLEDAEQDFGAALELNPHGFEALKLRAQTNLRLELYDRALNDAVKALAIRSDDPELLQISLQGNLHAQQFMHAVKDLERLIALQPDRTAAFELRLEHARTLEKAGLFAEALSVWRVLRQEQPERSEIEFRLLELLLNERNQATYAPAEALRLAEEVAKKSGGNSVQALLSLARAQRATGSVRQALATIERAYTKFPLDPLVQELRNAWSRP